MFVRRIKSGNGRTYIQVIDKSSGRYKVQKSFGSSGSKSEEQLLVNQAQEWIKNQLGVRELDFSNSEFHLEQFFDAIVSMKRVGYDLLLGRIPGRFLETFFHLPYQRRAHILDIAKCDIQNHKNWFEKTTPCFHRVKWFALSRMDSLEGGVLRRKTQLH